jgi:hypothetical protein
MPIKKLVELNGEFGGWLEIDPVRLKRAAIEFKNWLLQIDPNNDVHGFLEKDLPLVNSALDGTLPLPWRRSHPHSWELREDLLPRIYTNASADFYHTIRGSLEAPPEVIMKDGRYYAWAEWEDPPASEVNS